MMVNLPTVKYAEDHQVISFYDQVLKGIETLPGVQAVGATTSLPLTPTALRLRYTVDDQPPVNPAEIPRANVKAISPNYFRAMSIPLLKGRFFTEMDHDKSPPVIVINESLARKYWADQDAVGKRVTMPSLGRVSREIVGVVADVKHSSLDTESGAEIYVPYLQRPWSFMNLVVHTSSDPTNMIGAVRGEILSVDRNQSVYDVKTMEQVVSDSVSQPRLYTILLAVFASVALVLAAVGIYGVMNYSVTQRTHEIGIRLALGAQRGEIMRMVVGQGMILALIGVTVGLVAAFVLTFVLTQFLAGLLFAVGARDIATFIGIPLLLSIVALLSSYIPARRATRVDPMVALRHE
jgi:putative ABC transport system permease protein